MAFPVATGFFKGDWYDACQLYRQWAVKQVWCSKGPVAGRKDTPQCLKDCCMFLRQSSKGDGGRGVEFLSGTQTQHNLKNTLRCMELFGENIPSVWYSWWVKDKSRSAATAKFLATKGNGNDGQFVDAIPAVVTANRRIVAAGGYPTAYINAVIYDFGDAEDFKKAEHAAMRDIRGELYIHKGDPQACSMCRHAKWWQQRYAQLCTRAIKEFGFKGIYWDSYGKDNYRCFAVNHGHSYGGGTKCIQGEREFGKYVRKAIKQADPEAIISGEGCSEEFIDIVDTRLCLVVLHENAAPIFPAIYHDYQFYFGRRVDAGLPEPFFSMTTGYMFNIGGQLGRYGVSSSKGLDFDRPENAEKLRFFTTLINAKRSAKEFLNIGRMMRPPKMLSDVPIFTTKNPWYKKAKGVVTLPRLLCSAWKSPRGEVAVVFVNCDTNPIEFTYQIDTAEYGFVRKTKISRFNLADKGPEPEAVQGGRELIDQIVSGIYKETLSLPGHSVKIIVLSGNPAR